MFSLNELLSCFKGICSVIERQWLEHIIPDVYVKYVVVLSFFKVLISIIETALHSNPISCSCACLLRHYLSYQLPFSVGRFPLISAGHSFVIEHFDLSIFSPWVAVHITCKG